MTQANKKLPLYITSVDVTPPVYWFDKILFMTSHEIATYFTMGHIYIQKYIETYPDYIGEALHAPIWKVTRSRNRYSYALQLEGLKLFADFKHWNHHRHESCRITQRIEAMINALENPPTYTPKAPMTRDTPHPFWRA